ncbi:MAG: putative membrane protein [Natronomonas sp.]|jgi:putative membrane protein
MTQTQGDLAALSRFVFRAPDWSASLFFALLLAAVVGVAAFDHQFVLDDAYQGLVYIGIPTVAATFLTPWVDQLLGGRMTHNRSALLALLCEVIVVVFLVVAAVVALVADFGQTFVFDALLVALASIFAFRLFVIMAISRRSLLAAALPASIQTVVTAALLFVYSGTLRYLEVGGPLLNAYLAQPEEAPPELLIIRPEDFLVLAAICVLYAAAVHVFLVTIDRPWRQSLGVSVLDFIRGFIGHIAEGSDELEQFFEQLGEDAVVPVTVMGIRTEDGTEKARFVLPMIHPGPMGEIGGGNLPERIARSADGLAFPPHATAGHDFNLVTEREVDTLVDAAEDAHDRIDYTDEATPALREQEGESKLLGQAVGDDALVVATHAPGFADDVDFAVGLSTASEARGSGLGDVMLVDAHNCNNGLEGEDLGHVVPGSQRSFDMMAAADRLGERLVDADRDPLRVGVAWDPTDWDPEDGIGPLGVRVAITEVDDQRTAYVLVDGNNMEPGLREELLAAIDADEAEVMTTDNHVVNTMDATNQVGEAIDTDELVSLVEELVDEAKDDLEPVEAGMAVEHADVTVFGNDRTETLASTANAMVQIGGAFLLVVVGAAMAISLLVFLLAG